MVFHTKICKENAGNIISVTDPAGTITYNYRPDGQLDNIVAPESITTSFQYDDYDRQISMTDPSFGTIKYTYDAAGNVNKETYADGNITKKTYDKHHRLTKKEVAGQTITYTYNADNLIVSEVSSNGTSKTYEYDDLMRLKTLKETNVDGKWLQKTYAYNGGNVSSLTYASNTGNIVTENYTYSYGNLSEVKLNNTTSIWKLTSENAVGQPTGVSTGCLTRTYSYDTYGYPTGRVVKNGSTVIQNFGYSFNALTGNLNWRKDNTRNIQENFGYDNLNRLTSFAGKTVTYSNNGNITDISNVGSFTYDENKPYAVFSVTPYGTAVPLQEQQITYNGLKRPETITENGYVATFTYNGEGNRAKMNLKKNNQVQLNKYYWGNQYKVETGVAGSKEILYLGGDAYSAAAAYVKEGSGTWNIYYLCGDYLGNITHIINSSGGMKQELSYDAWGRLRNPANQSLYADGTEPALFLGRGYTRHEHLVTFGLINMNARLYDPVIGRFLSPDPQLQELYSSQNFNRYSYCLNNPLRYIDENGEFFFSIFAGIWKSIIQKRKFFKTIVNTFRNEVKIYGGIFITNKHKNFLGRSWELLSRITWQLPQTIMGETYSIVRNWVGLVDRVEYRFGATFAINEYSSKRDGMTLGSYININDKGLMPKDDNGKFAPEKDQLYMHEYGHYIQSQIYGWAYVPCIGAPSLVSAMKSKDISGKGYTTHSLRWYEMDANRRGKEYFQKYYNIPWDENDNPTHKPENTKLKY